MRFRRRRRFVFAVTGLAMMLSWVLYINKHSDRFKGNSFYSVSNEPIWIATEEPVDLYAGKIRRQLIMTTTLNDSTIVQLSACRLPSLDPFHPSLKSLIQELDPLDCGKLHSSFEKSILHVKGEDVVSVKYRIISRPEMHDFGVKLSDPVEIENIYKVEEPSNLYPIRPGDTGCIMHKESEKCLHPLGGQDIPSDGERAVLHSDCGLSRLHFKMTSSGVLRHVPSGLCLHVNTANASNHVTFEPKCSSKFKDLNGKVRVAKSQLCLQPRNESPENNDFLEAGKNCTHNFYFYKVKGIVQACLN
ncbi:uncharacterized protein LOC116299293 [Actinia tenebrosa]|uniref:Uncharacterized protein LOC116299293 n=1 Tax=Actinia tenebrosa TaxID=6105 RepID=A0A6P8I5E7_ACTTE|nr:uncharacterized protein LOC116299293 [Actinia tenebrosa]